MKRLSLFLVTLFFAGVTFSQGNVQYSKGDKTLNDTETAKQIFKTAPQEIVITDFRVEYRMFKGESVSGSKGSELTGTTYKTSASINVWLKDIGKEAMLAHTNILYDNFIKDLEAKGYKVETLDADKIRANKKFNKNKDALILSGTTYERTHKKIVTSITAVPDAVNIVKTEDPSKGVESLSGSMALAAEGAIIAQVLAGREVVRVAVTIAIDFFDFEKKGKLGLTKKLSGSPLLHIGGEHPSSVSFLFINKKYKFGTYLIGTNGEIFIESEDWAKDMNETKDFSFFGSSLKNYDLNADPAKYFDGVTTISSTFFNKSIEMYETFINSVKNK